MKVAVITDIHVDEQEDERVFTDVFVNCISNENPDVLLIGGDISEYYLRTLAFIRNLKKKLKAEVFYCLGNHDLWSKYEPGMTADDIIEYMESKGDESFVHNRVVNLTDKTVLVAGCGWYDYSFAQPLKFTEEELEKKEYMGRWWRDGLYARHGKSDKEVDRIWNEQLGRLVKDNKDKDTIFMTHMINHRHFLVGDDHPLYEMFQYFNGFMGSEGLYEITKKGNVKYAVSGHVHYRKEIIEDGITYMCKCLGYPKEYPLFGGEQRLEAQITDALGCFEIY